MSDHSSHTASDAGSHVPAAHNNNTATNNGTTWPPQRWFDPVFHLTRFITQTEYARLFAYLQAEHPAPPSPGPRIREEIDALVRSAFQLLTTPTEKAAAHVLDRLFKCTARNGLTKMAVMAQFGM